MTKPGEKRQSDWFVWVILLGFPIGAAAVIALAALPFYVLLGDRDSGIAWPLALGGPTAAGLFQLYRAAMWWRGAPLGDGDRSILDHWNFVDDSEDLRKAAVAEAIAEVVVAFSLVAFFFWIGTDSERVVAIVGGVASAAGVLLWLVVAMTGRPRWILPARYRRESRSAKKVSA